MSAQQRSFGAESLVAPTTGALNQGISGVAFGANHHQGAKNKNSKSTAESEALQLETQRMEEQLKLLRETMARGKEQKASSGRDTMWRAGGPAAKGSLSSYATDVLAKKNAALQRTKFTGLAQEADTRRKKLEDELRSQVQTSSQLEQQYQQYVAPQSAPPATTSAAATKTTPTKLQQAGDTPTCEPSQQKARGPPPQPPIGRSFEMSGGRNLASESKSPSRRSSEQLSRDYIHPQHDPTSRRGSEVPPPPPSMTARYPQPPPPQGRPTSRPPARMWRVPSGIAGPTSPTSQSTSPPTAATNPFLANPAHSTARSRRSSELYTSAPRRPSHVYAAEEGPRAGTDSSVVAVPPPPPRDIDSARDYIISAAEEGRGNDWSIGFEESTSPTDANVDPTPEVDSSASRKGSLLDGAYDEEASHRLFAEALGEWRSKNKKAVSTSVIPVEETKNYSNRRATVSGAPSLLDTTSARNASRPRRSTNNSDMYLPTHNETLPRSQPRARSGSLASFGQSFTNLTASLGVAFRRGTSTAQFPAPLPAHAASTPDLGLPPPPPPSTDFPSQSLPRRGSKAPTGSREGGSGTKLASNSSSAPDLHGPDPQQEQWRGVQSTESNHAINTSTSTDPASRSSAESSAIKATEAAFAQSGNGLTYMERLLLDKYRQGGGQSDSGSRPASNATSAAQRSHQNGEPQDEQHDLEMGEAAWEDHQVLTVDDSYGPPVTNNTNDHNRSNLQSRINQHSDNEAWSDDDSPVPVSTSPEKSRLSFSWKTSPAKSQSRAADIVIEDVTHNEEDALMASGRPVEVVGSDRLIVEEPDEHQQRQEKVKA